MPDQYGAMDCFVAEPPRSDGLLEELDRRGFARQSSSSHILVIASLSYRTRGADRGVRSGSRIKLSVIRAWHFSPGTSGGLIDHHAFDEGGRAEEVQTRRILAHGEFDAGAALLSQQAAGGVQQACGAFLGGGHVNDPG